MQRLSSRRAMQGMSLIEVLVSVVIIAIGLLGIAAMQSMALRGGQSSLESSQAVMQTQSILESMRANRANVAAYATGGRVCNPAAVVSANPLAQADLRNWLTSVKTSIGTINDASTCGQIAVNAAGTWTVTVQWDDDRAGGGNARTISTETRI